MFNVKDCLDDLRGRPTDWLFARRAELVREQRRLHVEQLAVNRVLDERGVIDTARETLESRDGISPRTARAELEVSRGLESLPAVAAAAHHGDLSWDQLKPLVEIATPENDAEWARRAPNCSPIDLERLAGRSREVTAEDAAARREARELRWWWRPGNGMLSVRGELPDVDGALVKSVLETMTERMKPVKGQPWDTLAHRGADALADLCRNYADAVPVRRARPHVVIHVPLDRPPEVDGIPLAHSTLAGMLEDAVVHETIVDAGAPVGTRRDTDDIPEAVKRFVRHRDQHCRIGTCEDTCTEYHHMVPRSEGGDHDPSTISLACKRRHHPMLEPNGPWRVVGDPSRPDGLRLVHHDDLALAGPSP